MHEHYYERKTSMKKKFIDLSVPIESDIKSDPPGFEPKINYINHKTSMPGLQQFFPGLSPNDMPNSEAWAFEKLEVITHNGTHLDAPYHFASTMNKGERAITIDEVDLSWCFQPGVKLDFRHFSDGYVVTASDIEKELKRIKHTLKPLEIVVVNTTAGERYGQDDYVSSGCGMGREATLFLLNQGVRVTGTDGWSWDAPFSHTQERYEATGDASLIWEGHKASLDVGYCHLEKLHNLDKLSPDGFLISCFPVNIKAASAGWTRAVAILEEQD